MTTLLSDTLPRQRQSPFCQWMGSLLCIWGGFVGYIFSCVVSLFSLMICVFGFVQRRRFGPRLVRCEICSIDSTNFNHHMRMAHPGCGGQFWSDACNDHSLFMLCLCVVTDQVFCCELSNIVCIYNSCKHLYLEGSYGSSVNIYAEEKNFFKFELHRAQPYWFILCQ